MASPGSRHDIVTALAGQHARDELVRARRQAVATRLLGMTQGQFSLAPLHQADGSQAETDAQVAGLRSRAGRPADSIPPTMSDQMQEPAEAFRLWATSCTVGCPRS